MLEQLSLDKFVISEATNLVNFIVTLAVLFFVLWLILFIFKFIVFKIYQYKSTDSEQDSIKELIYFYDKFCDNMSKKEKKNEVVNAIRDLFVWKGIRIPTVIIGWIIDMEVASIRKIQKSISKNTNLHPDDCDGECSRHKD